VEQITPKYTALMRPLLAVATAIGITACGVDGPPAENLALALPSTLSQAIISNFSVPVSVTLKRAPGSAVTRRPCSTSRPSA
jgi:hypothetical protein